MKSKPKSKKKKPHFNYDKFMVSVTLYRAMYASYNRPVHILKLPRKTDNEV